MSPFASLDPDWIKAKLQIAGVVPTLADYDLALELLSPNVLARSERTVSDDSDSPLCLVHGALRLSSNVIARDPGQFCSQMVGRLLSYRDMPAIARFTDRVAKGTGIPWLRPLHVALYPPGSALVRTLEGHTAAVWGVALSRDGRRAVSASGDYRLKVWEVESGRELHTLEGHTDRVWGVALSGDGRRAVSASWDHTLKAWEVESGVLLATFTCDSPAYCCAVSEALKLVGGGDTLGRVHFLELVEPKVNG